MQFVAPIPFDEALDKIGRRSPIGSTLSSSEWADVPVELRELASFSSRVESARVLQRGQDSITDFLAANREVLPDGQVALKTGSRAEFVDQMQAFLASEGIERGEGGLTDITSEARLGLIFNVQTQANQDYGYWKQGMDADVLDEFPAQRFIRVVDVKEPRQSHAQYENQVYLKTDPIWARVINADFGVPWGPWGWGCGHDVEDVDRAETESLGLLQPGEKVQPDKRALTDNLKASTKGLDPDLLDKLKNEFGDKLIIDGDTMRWNSDAVPADEPAKPEIPEPALPADNTVWKDSMDRLLKDYKQATVGDLPALREQARTLIEVPAADRGTIDMTVAARNAAVIKTANQGKEIIERFVAADLVNNTEITLRATNDIRSFHRRGEIHLWAGADKSTAAHEIMHAVEQQNPAVLQAAAEFLLERSQGEQAISLKKLTSMNYKADERAFEDKWRERYGSVYAGKVYSQYNNPTSPSQFRATEVLTMGIERLIADPLEFYQNDRGWFDFVVKVLRGL